MANNIVVPQLNVDEEDINAWERKVYTLPQEHKLYSDWATYFSSIQNLDQAAQFYDKALELIQNDPKTIYLRSVCRRKIAHIQDALNDALKADELEPDQARNSMAIGYALYQLNQFENALVEFYHGKTMGSVVKDFVDSIFVVNLTLKMSLSDLLQAFFNKHVRYNKNMNEMLKSEKVVDEFPNWKKLRDEDKCDVMSILDKNEIRLSPLEIARRKRTFRIFNQTYFNRGWIDAVFLHKLRNKERASKHATVFKPILIDLLESKCQMVKTFSKMLQARNPLYSKNALKFTNETLREKLKQRYLNGVQYQTRRIMMITLRQIKQLRKQGKIEELAKYIETVMGDFVVLKTHRVMPWKFEFVNEVYNTLALAYSDLYTVIEVNLGSPDVALQRLLKVPIQSNYRTDFIFGDKSTSFLYAYNEKYQKYKRFIDRLENRMLFAKYAIEKAYLRYEMAQVHLKQHLFSECFRTAKMAIDESKTCGNDLWAFLSQMLIVKAHTATNKIQLCREGLYEAYNICKKLRNENLCLFVETAYQINEEHINLKQRERSAETIRKRKYSTMTLDVEDETSLNSRT